MIGVYMRPSAMTEAQYHEINEKIGAAGVEPVGMLVHTVFGEGEGLAIFDVWESEEAFQAFGAKLAPFLGEANLEPMIVPMIDFQLP